MIKNKILEMYKLQNKLNIDTNGKEWTKGITTEGREINWSRCIFMETAEAIESIGSWKHWKDLNAATDYNNIKIELVDIIHFLISDHITGFEGNIDEAAEDFYKRYNATKDNTPTLSLLESLEAIAKQALNGYIPVEEFINAVNLMEDFNMDEVYKLYLGKNCLNTFRQAHNYKNNIPGASPYKKIINGKEDNVYMQNFLNENSDVGYEELYSYMTDIYNNIK